MKESREVMEEALSLEDNAALITLLITQEKLKQHWLKLVRCPVDPRKARARWHTF